MSRDDKKHGKAHAMMAELLSSAGLRASGVDTEDDLFEGFSNVAVQEVDIGNGHRLLVMPAMEPKWGIPIGTALPTGCVARFPRPRTGLHRFTDTPSEDDYEEQLTILWAVHPNDQAEVTHYEGHGSRRVLIPRSDVDVSVPCTFNETGTSYVRD